MLLAVFFSPKEPDIVDNLWLAGEGDDPACGTGPLVGWVYDNRYAFSLISKRAQVFAWSVSSTWVMSRI